MPLPAGTRLGAYDIVGAIGGGGLGVKLAAPDREVFVLVGDGSYLMMAQELVTAIQEGLKVTCAQYRRVRKWRRSATVEPSLAKRRAVPTPSLLCGF
jgi:thiamine pyrophosphate-dependent acetolactate synthase large subunit-like protein